jgi:hypothetical protein
MSSQLDHAANALFPLNGPNRVANIKFYRGHSREITADQMADQFSRADAQVRAGQAERIDDIDAEVPGQN